MSDLVLPPALRDVETVRGIRTPARLDYTFTAGAATSRFLRGIAAKKIYGERCGTCGKVILPPRGSCPNDGVPTSEQVELPDRGIVTTFCVVNVKFSGSAMELPYVCADRLIGLAALGIDRFVVTGPGFGSDRDDARTSTRLLVGELIPALRERAAT